MRSTTIQPTGSVSGSHLSASWRVTEAHANERPKARLSLVGGNRGAHLPWLPVAGISSRMTTDRSRIARRNCGGRAPEATLEIRVDCSITTYVPIDDTRENNWDER
jgi:hypothetical protein